MANRIIAGTRKGLFILKPDGEGWTVERTAFLGSPVPTVLHDKRDGTLYASLDLGHFGGKLHRSDDFGESWQEVAAPAYPKAEEGAEGESLKLLWTLAAGGPGQNGMLWAGTIPEGYWIQHHSGIFRSTDDLESWQDIPSMGPSIFGFAVAVHPKDPDTAWFAPAIKDEFRYPVDGKFVVTRTRDGGRTSEVLDNGLPQATSYDLVYRHGLDVDETGNGLAMGSTSGGVWTSANGGDSWTLLPDRLPPVYTVRFTTV